MRVAAIHSASVHQTIREGCSRCALSLGTFDDGDWNPKPPPFVPAPAQRPRNLSVDGWRTEPRRPRRPAPVQKVIPILVPQRDPFGGLFSWDDN